MIKKKLRRMRLTREEKAIDDALVRGEYKSVSKTEFERFQRALANTLALRRKNKVLNIRINGHDLELIKKKAQKFGVKYQTLIAEYLHQWAHHLEKM